MCYCCFAVGRVCVCLLCDQYFHGRRGHLWVLISLFVHFEWDAASKRKCYRIINPVTVEWEMIGFYIVESKDGKPNYTSIRWLRILNSQSEFYGSRHWCLELLSRYVSKTSLETNLMLIICRIYQSPVINTLVSKCWCLIVLLSI